MQEASELMAMHAGAPGRPAAVPSPALVPRVAPPAARPPARVPDAVLGLLIFLGTEAMFFAGLISAFLVLRAGSTEWPPPDQPRLPVAVTGVNTLVLLLSGYTVGRARSAIRRARTADLAWWLTLTALLGTVFLAIQGTEWVRLVGYGLRATSGVYGATFYTLIGCHGLHVLGGVLALLVVLRHAVRGGYSARDHVGVEACRLYWSFVVAIWPVLYALVYLL